jgi:hypothetical protein
MLGTNEAYGPLDHHVLKAGRHIISKWDDDAANVKGVSRGVDLWVNFSNSVRIQVPTGSLKSTVRLIPKLLNPVPWLR